MTDLICPPDYSCSFTKVHPRVITHVVNPNPWWHGTFGWIVVIIAIIAIACVVAYAIDLIHEGRENRASRKEHERQLAHDLDIEEQRTMQIDAAKGNPEMLHIVQELQRR